MNQQGESEVFGLHTLYIDYFLNSTPFNATDGLFLLQFLFSSSLEKTVEASNSKVHRLITSTNVRSM